MIVKAQIKKVFARLLCFLISTYPEIFEVLLLAQDQPAPLCKRDSTGDDNPSRQSATTARLLVPCQRQRLIDTMNVVVVDRPSPK